MLKILLFFSLLFFSTAYSQAIISLGIDNFFKNQHTKKIKGKRIALYTNHTGQNKDLKSTLTLFATDQRWHLKTVFTPEHGLHGQAYNNEQIEYNNTTGNRNGQPIFISLVTDKERPTKAMLANIDALIIDIQDIGIRAYTYSTTLFYLIEAAALAGTEVIVLDRPNPINGITVDGPMMNQKLRSRLGYINIAYCHGMTIGELALFFNTEYKIGAKLEVIPMQGWRRNMTFKETGLPWIPSSPHIPEMTTPIYAASTGVLGELGIVNIGIGYTLPFKVVGAPWMHANNLAISLNEAKLPGVIFHPIHYRPFYGNFKGQDCQGVLIIVTDHQEYQPLLTQFLILDSVRSRYPTIIKQALSQLPTSTRIQFQQVIGSTDILSLLESNKPNIFKDLSTIDQQERKHFLKKREQYLLPQYPLK